MERERAFALGALAAIAAITAAWWALALWPEPDAGTAWLARTREVCFGATPSGLPDARGWALLVGQPLGMLALLLIGWGRATRAALGALVRSRAGRLAVTGTALALLVGAGAAVARVAEAASGAGPPAPSSGGATPRPADRPAPSDLDLIDQRGHAFSLAGLRGRPTLVTFAFAHCETVCPVLVRDVLDAQRLAERDGAARPRVVILTVDPWRDTPARLPRMAEQWALPPDAHLLSGPVAKVLDELDAWGVSTARDERTGEVTHPALVYVLDGAGRVRFAATGGGAPVAALLHRL